MPQNCLFVYERFFNKTACIRISSVDINAQHCLYVNLQFSDFWNSKFTYEQFCSEHRSFTKESVQKRDSSLCVYVSPIILDILEVKKTTWMSCLLNNSAKNNIANWSVLGDSKRGTHEIVALLRSGKYRWPQISGNLRRDNNWLPARGVYHGRCFECLEAI